MERNRHPLCEKCLLLPSCHPNTLHRSLGSYLVTTLSKRRSGSEGLSLVDPGQCVHEILHSAATAPTLKRSLSQAGQGLGTTGSPSGDPGPRRQGAACLVVPEGPPKPTCSLRPPESLDPKALERRGSLHEDEGYQRGHGGYQWSAPTRKASGQRLPINQYLQDHGLSQGWETPARSASLQTPTHRLKIARSHYSAPE